MNIESKIFDRLGSKVEFKSNKFEFGVLQDAAKIIDGANKDFDNAFGLISGARTKSEPLIKNAISEAQKFLNQFSESQKIANELGIDLPAEYVGLKQKAEFLIGEAKDVLNWINKY